MGRIGNGDTFIPVAGFPPATDGRRVVDRVTLRGGVGGERRDERASQAS